MTDRCKLITRHPEDFERIINALEKRVKRYEMALHKIIAYGAPAAVEYAREALEQEQDDGQG